MRGPHALAGMTLFLVAGFAATATVSPSLAQVPYQIGDGNPSVTVNLGVLDTLGPVPTVPQLLRPGLPSGQLAPAQGGTPAQGARPTDTAPAPAWLRRPDAPVYAAPPAGLLTRAAPRPSAPKTAALTPPKPRAPAPSVPKPATVKPAAPKPTVAAATKPKPAPTPPPAPTVTETPKAPPPPPVIPKAPEPPKPPAAIAEIPKPKAETQVAAVPPASSAPSSAPAPAASAPSISGDQIRLVFPSGQSQLPAEARTGLDSVIAKLKKDQGLRVQLLAYADGDQGTANKARRLSLSRALAVRAYLIDAKIQSTRMDVRALGNRAQEAPKDRVDVVLVSR